MVQKRDQLHRADGEINRAGSVAQDALAAAGGVTRYDYDAANRIVRKTNALGVATTYEYDANGRAVKEMVDDPAHYRWTSYRANGLGQAEPRLTPHALYRALGGTDKARQTAYRALFSAQLDHAVIDDIRLALNQSQPLGNERFHARIVKMTGVRREARARGRPRREDIAGTVAAREQGELGL